MKRSLLIFPLVAAVIAPLHAQSNDKKPVAFARVVPERKDDLAWENDLGAYRIYGPELARTSKEGENSGIDVWFKRVPYSVINAWYADDLAGKRSYHDPKGTEGYDGFKVGPTRGCGGTALWDGDKMILSGVYRTAKILSAGPKEAKFTVAYRYDTPQGPVDETKTITSKVGDPFFESHSVFTRDGKHLAGLEVAIGLVAQTPKAKITLVPQNGVMAIWDEVDGAGFGIGAIIPKNVVVKMLQQPAGKSEHALVIAKTNATGELTFRAGAAWSKGSSIKSDAQWLAALNAAAK